MDILKATRIVALLLIVYADKTGSSSRCASYPDPKNGYITCDSLFHLFCSPECHPGYRFVTKPAVVYMCGPVTGEWFTYPVGTALPWPDCIPEDRDDNTIHEELAKQRAEMTKYMADKHTGIPSPYYSRARKLDPEERYHHLFDYIERAQKAYEYREAIERETEKLKHQNIAQKGVQSNSHIGSVQGNVGPSVAPKPWLSNGNNVDRRWKDHEPTNGHQTGLSKGNFQQTIAEQKEPILRYDQRDGYKNNHISNLQNNAPKTLVNENGFLPASGHFTAKMTPSYIQPNLHFNNGNSQNNIISSKINIEKKEKTSHYKKDSNFVLKMLNNEEFKDLHYLDEHVRLHRDASTSSSNKKVQPIESKGIKKDKSTPKNSFDKNEHLEFKNSKVDTKDSRSRDNSTGKANTGIKEHQDLSSHVVPIVMSGETLLQSFSSLLGKHNLNTGPEKPKTLNSLIKEENKNEETQSKNSTSAGSKDLSLGENIFSVNKKSNAKQNGHFQSILENSKINIKSLYESWMKRNRSSMNFNSNAQEKNKISLPQKKFSENKADMSSQNNADSMRTIQGGKTFQRKEENDHNASQTPRERTFYFPIKKDKLIEILNQANLKPKTQNSGFKINNK